MQGLNCKRSLAGHARPRYTKKYSQVAHARARCLHHLTSLTGFYLSFELLCGICCVPCGVVRSFYICCRYSMWSLLMITASITTWCHCIWKIHVLMMDVADVASFNVDDQCFQAGLDVVVLDDGFWRLRRHRINDWLEALALSCLEQCCRCSKFSFWRLLITMSAVFGIFVARVCLRGRSAIRLRWLSRPAV